MERRVFIASALGIVGAGAAGGAVASPAASVAPRRIVCSYVTGFRPEGLAALARMEAGAALVLEPAPERRFDPGSVAVRAGGDGVLLGYLPGTHSRILAPLLEHGLALRGTALSVQARPRPSLHLDVSVAA